MFLSIEDLSAKELRKLEMTFGKRLSAYQNIHYQMCVEEIICALENESEDYEEFRNDPLFATFVSEMAQELYSFTCYDFDNIYEKAVEVVHNK